MLLTEKHHISFTIWVVSEGQRHGFCFRVIIVFRASAVLISTDTQMADANKPLSQNRCGRAVSTEFAYCQIFDCVKICEKDNQGT